MEKPKKWYDVYAYGTKEGEEEAKFFRFLVRHQTYTWRSTAAIVQGTGLSQERVEEIIDKYVNQVNPPLLYPHPSNEDHWGYWERNLSVLEKDERNISTKDKDNRVNKHMSGTDMVGQINVAKSDSAYSKMSRNELIDIGFNTYSVADKALVYCKATMTLPTAQPLDCIVLTYTLSF